MNETDKEITQKLLLKLSVIETQQHETDEVISPICVVQKQDGTYRLILNLKISAF